MLQTATELTKRVRPGKSNAFQKIFNNCMNAKEIIQLEWTITPARATEMLKFNTNNRSVKNALVERLARDMENGQWVCTGQPIIFSDTRLLDGQHRLLACISAKADFHTHVTFGIDDKSFAYIDAGAIRSPGDVFRMHGVKNGKNMAAATKIVHAYKEGQLSALKKVRLLLNHEELYQKYLQFPGLEDGSKYGSMWQTEKLCTSNAVTAAFYICQEINRRDAEFFFNKVGDSVGFDGKNDPGLILQKFLRRNRDAGYSVRNYDAVGAIITGWNAFREKRRPRSLKFALGDPCPEAI